MFVNGLEAYDGEINLGVEKNIISNEFAVKLCLENEVKRGNKVVKKELIIALRGEIYFVKFIINTKEDDVEPGVVFGRSFLRLTKAIADFGNETVMIYPELDPFLVSFDEGENIRDDWDLLLDDLNFGDILDIDKVDVPQFVCKMGKNSRNKRKQLEKYQLIYSDIGPSMSTRTPLTQEEDEREALAISIYERYSILEEERPIIETIAYSDKYKKILDEICVDKRKLDGMNKEEEEAIIRIKGEALIEKDDPGAFRGSTECKEGDLDVKSLKGRADGDFEQCSVPTKTSLDTTESDRDDKEEYAIKRNKFGALIYGPKLTRYLNCHDPLDRSLALQEVMNPFRKICVWKKVVSFLRSLPIVLQHVEWKPDYTGCFIKKEDSDGQWHAEIRLTDPYGNIYDQSFVTQRTTRKLAKYHKLSDIMSPNWFQN
ncbi:hypothetical protein Tco_1008287 [Tanacetum coccineum]